MDLELKKGRGKQIILLDEAHESTDELYLESKKGKFFSGKKNESYGNVSGTSTLLWGLGEKKDALEVGISLQKALRKAHVKDATIDVSILDEEHFKLFCEGLLTADYFFDRYKEREESSLKAIYLTGVKGFEEALKEVKGIALGQTLTKDLANTRSNDLYPETLAKTTVDELTAVGVEVEVYGKEDIEELKLEAFLQVARGSDKEPRLIVMNYKGNPESDKVMALIGKGLTYDSGGYGIKPTDGMFSMFTDMTGAATVIGAIKALALNKVKENVVGIVLACENMIDGDAYKNGDIIGSLYGKTIEIHSTDAEGRLTLADAVTYTERRFHPTVMLDIATLTGACAIALGNVSLGAYANDKKVMDRLLKASKVAHEHAWALPDFEEYRELLKTPFADLKNSGGVGAGATTAGMFIEAFIDDTPWIHLDIAGTSYRMSPKGVFDAGATGFGTKMLYYFVKEK
ncbi:leucyl aminopeptidase [Guggenheimella bovis]